MIELIEAIKKVDAELREFWNEEIRTGLSRGEVATILSLIGTDKLRLVYLQKQKDLLEKYKKSGFTEYYTTARALGRAYRKIND